MTTADDWARLATEVKRRREQLYMRQRDVEFRGGPGPGTMRNIEQATRDGYALRTFDSLERALEWAPGTITRILDGTAATQEVTQRATDDEVDPELRWDALADAVRQRRAWLGLTQEQLAPRGGPSSRAVRDIEAGRLRPLTENTLAKLDRSLDWDHATAQSILDARLVDEEPVLRWDNLGDAIRRRRTELRLPQELGTRGGPSEITVRKLERAEVTTIRGRTKTQIEQALQWPVGHVDRLLAGTADSDDLRAASEPLQRADAPPAAFTTTVRTAVDDARALRIGRLLLALLDEMRPA